MISCIVIQLTQLYTTLAGQRTFREVIDQSLQYCDGLVLPIEHGECTAFLVKGIVKILRVGIATHHVIQCGNLTLVVML
ncbi:hypothetical protein SDC9_150262 [bioreactor metagenome]|uniref:Uncharacterized protein n=1 Tax=bioreactor metagenome TaxID=1076179 RepID=A0A645EPG0_9ZZZZ